MKDLVIKKCLKCAQTLKGHARYYCLEHSENHYHTENDSHHPRWSERCAATTVGAVAHVDGHTAMEAHGAYGQLFLFGGIAVKLIGHVIPIVCGIAKVGAYLAIILMDIAMASDALDG